MSRHCTVAKKNRLFRLDDYTIEVLRMMTERETARRHQVVSLSDMVSESINRRADKILDEAELARLERKYAKEVQHV